MGKNTSVCDISDGSKLAQKDESSAEGLNAENNLSLSTGIEQQQNDPKIEISLRPKPEIAAFLTKLYNMVNDNGSDELIKWSDDGNTFIVTKQDEFSEKVLPKFFKHGNFSSFVRQLNMYGFHKVPHVLSDKNLKNSEFIEFVNENFRRGKPELMSNLKRRAHKSSSEETFKADITCGKRKNFPDIDGILNQLTSIRNAQQKISKEMNLMRQQNTALWKEKMYQEERQKKQEQIIEKILRFLASVYSTEKLRSLDNNSIPFAIRDDQSPEKPKKRRKYIGSADYSSASSSDSALATRNNNFSTLNSFFSNPNIVESAEIDGKNNAHSSWNGNGNLVELGEHVESGLSNTFMNGRDIMKNESTNTDEKIELSKPNQMALVPLPRVKNDSENIHEKENFSLKPMNDSKDTEEFAKYRLLENNHQKLSDDIEKLQTEVDEITQSLGLSANNVDNLNDLDVNQFLDDYMLWPNDENLLSSELNEINQQI